MAQSDGEANEHANGVAVVGGKQREGGEESGACRVIDERGAQGENASARGVQRVAGFQSTEPERWV